MSEVRGRRLSVRQKHSRRVAVITCGASLLSLTPHSSTPAGVSLQTASLSRAIYHRRLRDPGAPLGDDEGSGAVFARACQTDTTSAALRGLPPEHTRHLPAQLISAAERQTEHWGRRSRTRLEIVVKEGGRRNILSRERYRERRDNQCDLGPARFSPEPHNHQKDEGTPPPEMGK